MKLTPIQVSKLLQIDSRTVYRMIHSNKLPYILENGDFRIEKNHIDNLLKNKNIEELYTIRDVCIFFSISFPTAKNIIKKSDYIIINKKILLDKKDLVNILKNNIYNTQETIKILPEEPLIGKNEVLSIMGIHNKTLYNWLALNKITYYRFDKMFRFDKKYIESLVHKKGKIQ